ncbi:MAG: MotA/TolQ/ExbB proton channel family protein [Planctomyces sp.]|nr:MotA/TolQ/ExbB proton channel family protein [Planctomyces sp.]
MDYALSLSGPVIYTAQALSAMYGVFLFILLMRKIREKRFASEQEAEQFLSDVRERMDRKDFEGAGEVCDSPPYWSKAVPQLILLALANRDRGVAKLRGLLTEKFERDVVADLTYRHSGISMVVKTAPMLGLLGTVTGMILAFAKIATASSTGTDPKQLADDISLALLTTMWGLTIAIPMTMLGGMVQVRISKLVDSVQEHLGEFFHDLERALSD